MSSDLTITVEVADYPAIRNAFATVAAALTERDAEIVKLRDTLRSVTWCESDADDQEHCLTCGNDRAHGHWPDCALAALLEDTARQTPAQILGDDPPPGSTPAQILARADLPGGTE